MIVIAVEGGVVFNVSKDPSLGSDDEFLIIDYDTEGMSDDEVTVVTFKDGKTAEVFAHIQKMETVSEIKSIESLKMARHAEFRAFKRRNSIQ